MQDPDHADILEVARSTLRGLDLRVSEDTCTARVQGTLTTSSGEPLPGVLVIHGFP